MAVKIKTSEEAKNSYDQHLTSDPVQCITTTSKLIKGTEYDVHSAEEVVHKGVFTKKNTGMKIEFAGGRTINLGNYESARVDVRITVPCDPEALEEAYQFASEWVSEKINAAVNVHEEKK